MKYYARVSKQIPESQVPYANRISLYWYLDGDAVVKRTGDDGKVSYVTIPISEYKDILEPVYEAFVAPQLNNFRMALAFTGDINSVALPQIFSHTGDFLPVPDPYTVDFPEILVNNQPRYESAKLNPAAGDIIVSPFQRGTLKVVPGPGHIVSSYGSESDRIINARHVLQVPSIDITFPYIIGGMTFTRVPNLRMRFAVANVEEKPGNNEFDHDAFMSQIISNCTPTSIVTEVVAEANRGTVDLLTTLAESPKSAKSALRGVMTILQMYKDARNREFRLRDQVKQINAKWDKKISRLENLDIRDNAALKTASMQQSKDVNKVLHAIANIWLTYRLEILPLSIAVDGMSRQLTLQDHMVQFQRFRGFDRYQIPFTGFPIPYDFRVFIKRSVVPGRELSSYYSFNVATTLWELTWLSFVVDRYINIGDWLTANLNNPRGYTHKEGSTFSWKVNTTVKLGDANVTIDFSKRTVFSSDSYCPLQYPETRSRKQDLDHLALLWSIFSKKL